ncbi:MAG: hypothetical protein PWP74_1012 [Shewanella sp.]|nr:hypothetical protein [Shewanella sp.]
MAQKVRVWDLPVRVFHWLTVLLFGLLWWTAEQGEMQWHQLCAYLLLINLSVRIVWGFIGSLPARFSHFVVSPQTVVKYWRQQYRQHHAGHNPLGGYMVLALMCLLVLQLGSGMFATDDIFIEGPLYSLVSDEVAHGFTWLHKRNFDLLLILIAVHISAVLVHEFHGNRLVCALISGNKTLPDGVMIAEQPGLGWRWWLLLLLIAAPITYWLILPLLASW